MRPDVLIGLLVGLGSLISCTRYRPEKVAEMRALEAESAARLVMEGESLLQADRTKLTGYEYCSRSVSHTEQGELRRGIREASKALFLGKRRQNDDLLAHAYRDLAYAYSFAGNLERAKGFAEDAISHMRRSSRLDNGRVLGRSYKIRGDVHLRQGKVDQAMRDYQQALEVSPAVFRPFVLSSLAHAHLANGNVKQARQLFHDAESTSNATLESIRRRGLGYVALAEGQHHAAIQWFTEAANQLTTPEQIYHRIWAFEGIARAHLATRDQASAIQAYMRAIEAAEQVRTRFRSEEFKTGFFGNVQRIFDDTVALLMETGQAAMAFDVSERSRARALLDLVKNRPQISADTMAFSDPFRRPISVSQLRQALPEDVAVVEYHILPHQTYAWVVRRSGITTVTLEIDRETLRHTLYNFRKWLSRQAINVPRIASDLYEQLVQPLQLLDTEDLVIIPHDALHHMPFQALLSPKGYLIETRTLSYAPSASVLMHLLRQPPQSRERVLALGNPELGAPHLALPGAQREVEQIKHHFPNAEVYIRHEATKERFLSQAPQSNVVHIAAHAEVDPIDPLHSAIRFAPTEKSSGKLEAHEVYHMNLSRTAITILSACDTGFGRVSRGDELWGFLRPFLSAGTRALLVSLWPVDDVSTAQLMARFYEALPQKDAHRALRVAQLEVLRDTRFRHPFFWAPFNFIGDWR